MIIFLINNKATNCIINGGYEWLLLDNVLSIGFQKNSGICVLQLEHFIAELLLYPYVPVNGSALYLLNLNLLPQQAHCTRNSSCGLFDFSAITCYVYILYIINKFYKKSIIF